MSDRQQVRTVDVKNKSSTKQDVSSKNGPSLDTHPSAIVLRARTAPGSLTPVDVLQLQRTIGNQAVGQLLAEIGNIPSTIQQSPVQRQEIPEEEELMQGKMMDTVQRQEIPEEEELMQGKIIETVQRQGPEEEELMQGKFASGLTGTLQAKEEAPSNRTGMPDHLKSGLENLSGMDLSAVRVHYNSSKPTQINALAYTQGKNIHVASGQEKHIPHEGWHVVQQSQGRVRPTLQAKGVAINDDAELEKEADVMGKRAGEIGRLPSTSQQVPVQRQGLEDEEELMQGKFTDECVQCQIPEEEELMQGKMIETATSPEVTQKMAVMAVDNFNDQEDPLVWNNIENAVSKATGPIGDLRDNKVWDQLDNNEEIRIVEHGEVRKVGGLKADKIAGSMFTPPNELPVGNKIGKITFQSCYAGVSGGIFKGSLVSDMVGELKDKGQTNIPVEGRTGIAFGFKGMGEATAETSKGKYVWHNRGAKTKFTNDLPGTHEKGLKAYCEAMYELQNSKTKTTNKDIFDTPFEFFGYQEPWELLDITEIAWNALNVDERSNKVAEEMETYWKDLKEKMEGFGGFKPPEKAIKKDIKKSGHCFLTTACIEAKGLPDDCKELTVLRNFRDGYMNNIDGGMEMIKEYYDIAPKIVRNIYASNEAKKEFVSLYGDIEKCVDLIEKDKNSEAIKIYRQMVLRLKVKWILA
ncbi:MAG: DUF4157 domain-containing protein [Methanosarcinaceae archaeon]|nr:DUF4157 domain-containing protein [Methanosarcinaceae archaeon]